MSTDDKSYSAEQGDHFSKIALKSNFSDWYTLWEYNLSNNSDFSALGRSSANLLYEGDPILIPQPDDQLEDECTEKECPYETPSEDLRLRLRILGEDKKPLADAEYELTIRGTADTTFTGTTDSNGQIELDDPIAADAVDATLTVKVTPESSTNEDGSLAGDTTSTWNLKLGWLNPINGNAYDVYAPNQACISGVKQRLTNLGFPCGDPDNESLTADALSSIEIFRSMYGLSDIAVTDEDKSTKLADADFQRKISDQTFQNKLWEVCDKADSVVDIEEPSG